MILPNGLAREILACGFEITYNSKEIDFLRITPAGRQFWIMVDAHGLNTEEWDDRKTIDYCIAEVQNFAEEYDISTETYYLLDEEGHGILGMPYDMRAVYNDVEISAGYIKEIEQVFRRYCDDFFKKE